MGVSPEKSIFFCPQEAKTTKKKQSNRLRMFTNISIKLSVSCLVVEYLKD